MPADKELTKRITHKDLKKTAKNLALPNKTMCKSAVGWELEVMCPNYKKNNKPELVGNYGRRHTPHIGAHGENLENMYIHPKNGEKVGKCMVTGKPCDHKHHGKRALGDCETCCYAG
jgi:hypothetical protein